jgi:hypothetical protein
VAERVGEVGLVHADRDGNRLQHLRTPFPCQVRVIAETHPLFGLLLEAASFKRVSGVLYLVVGLPDGTPGTIPAAATNVFGEAPGGARAGDGAVSAGHPSAAQAGRGATSWPRWR